MTLPLLPLPWAQARPRIAAQSRAVTVERIVERSVRGRGLARAETLCKARARSRPVARRRPYHPSVASCHLHPLAEGMPRAPLTASVVRSRRALPPPSRAAV